MAKENLYPSLIQRVERMVFVTELLLETVNYLSDEELRRFKRVLRKTDFDSHYSSNLLMQLEMKDAQDAVFLMVLTDGQQSVEKTKEVLEEMSRTDLVQRLLDSTSGLIEKHCVDEDLSALIHKVATMAAVKELLLETLSDLSSGELKKFKWLLQFTLFQRSLPLTSWRRALGEDGADLAEMMVEMFGQQFVEVTKEVFMDMNRTDLVQILSETSSEKHCVDQHCPALTQKVETMASVIELLLGTLKDLSHEEDTSFKQVVLNQPHVYRSFHDVKWMMQQQITDIQDTVFLMVLTDGQQSVERTTEILKKMRRTDLVQRLSDRSSGPKKKDSDEHRAALIQKVATMAAVKHLLLETLNDLSNEELNKFMEFLQCIVSEKILTYSPLMIREPSDRSAAVDQLVWTFSQESVEITREVLQIINKTDLMQRLSKLSSGLKEKHQPALAETITNAALKSILFESLKDLSHEELKTFRWSLQFTYFKKSLPHIPWRILHQADRTDVLVHLMVRTCGQQSVEVTREVFMDMNRTDLVERLSETSSGLTEKHRSKPIQKEETMTPDQEVIYETYDDVSDEELRRCEIFQQGPEIKEGAFKKRTMRPVVKMTPVKIVKRRSGRLELEGGGSVLQDSSDWTKLEPEVNSTDADESPTYSLESEAGNFECGVSGLRWVCKHKVSFKYQFCSWEEPMERMEGPKYMAAGPLIDINVIAGNLDEVHLPHWICIHDNPSLLDRFAVLHVDDCGDVVEKVSEVTSSHVKLSEPVFSPRGVLMKIGLPVKISCNVLIYYKPNTAFLMLHIYLIPLDPALQQTMDKKKKGFKKIQKPRPDPYLKMHQGFKLTADTDTATIQPEKITLRYDSQDPNFYEVFIENPEGNFHLTLSQLYKHKNEQQCEPVWNCEIRKVDYQNSGDSEAAESTGPCDGATEREKPGKSVSASMPKESTNTTDRVRLLKALEDLNQLEFIQFKWYLQNRHILAGLPGISRHRLENTDMLHLVDLMLHAYGQQSVEVTKKVFKEINRNDLVQELSDTSSGSKAAGSSA